MHCHAIATLTELNGREHYSGSQLVECASSRFVPYNTSNETNGTNNTVTEATSEETKQEDELDKKPDEEASDKTDAEANATNATNETETTKLPRGSIQNVTREKTVEVVWI